MPLPLASLDTRTFDELLEEARAMLPRGAPAWSDHNYHDPGITLIELFAWLAETAFYRLDQTSDANVRAFLRLVGVEPRVAGVSETVLLFAGAPAAGQWLPAGLQVGDASGRVVMQTAEPLFVSAASLVSVSSGSVDAPSDHTADNASTFRYAALGAAPRPGDALYLAFDRPFATAAATLSLHLWARDAEVDRREVQRVRDEYAAAEADARRDARRPASRTQRRWREHWSARTIWEYGAAGGVWKPLRDVVDETRALTTSGAIRVAAPLDIAPWSGASAPPALAGRFVIRCRLTGGAYDMPPTILRVALNAVQARHECDVLESGVGYRSSGRAGQVIELSRAPVVPGSTVLRVMRGAVEDSQWREAPHWDGVGPHARAYVLDSDAAQLTFGNGRIGRVPAAAAQIIVRYRTGGGVAGNVAAGTIDTVRDVPHNAQLVTGWPAVRSGMTVAQPFAATGGAAPEVLASAKARAVELLTKPDRAVTLADFEALALAVPCAPVARAFAIPEQHPSHPGIAALGAVTVVIVPAWPDGRPEPHADLCAEVARYLCRRRPVTTEVHVVGPCYKKVTVHAHVHASATDSTRLTHEAVTALEAFLHPLRGGPDGTGWPIGRAVYRTEVMAVLSQLPGVAYVDDLRLQVCNEDAARCGNADICPRGLVTSGTHRITIVPEAGR